MIRSLLSHISTYYYPASSYHSQLPCSQDRVPKKPLIHRHRHPRTSSRSSSASSPGCYFTLNSTLANSMRIDPGPTLMSPTNASLPCSSTLRRTRRRQRHRRQAQSHQSRAMREGVSTSLDDCWSLSKDRVKEVNTLDRSFNQDQEVRVGAGRRWSLGVPENYFSVLQSVEDAPSNEAVTSPSTPSTTIVHHPVYIPPPRQPNYEFMLHSSATPFNPFAYTSGPDPATLQFPPHVTNPTSTAYNDAHLLKLSTNPTASASSLHHLFTLFRSRPVSPPETVDYLSAGLPTATTTSRTPDRLSQVFGSSSSPPKVKVALPGSSHEGGDGDAPLISLYDPPMALSGALISLRKSTSTSKTSRFSVSPSFRRLSMTNASRNAVANSDFTLSDSLTHDRKYSDPWCLSGCRALVPVPAFEKRFVPCAVDDCDLGVTSLFESELTTALKGLEGEKLSMEQGDLMDLAGFEGCFSPRFSSDHSPGPLGEMSRGIFSPLIDVIDEHQDDSSVSPQEEQGGDAKQEDMADSGVDVENEMGEDLDESVEEVQKCWGLRRRDAEVRTDEDGGDVFGDVELDPSGVEDEWEGGEKEFWLGSW